jgi:hypothetical protein
MAKTQKRKQVRKTKKVGTKAKRTKGFGMKHRGDRITIKTDELSENPWNPNEQDDDMKKRTGASLHKFGIVSEVLVREIGPDNKEKEGLAEEKGYQVIDGEHRWRECVKSKIPRIEVRNLGVISDYEAMKMTPTMNDLSGDPEPIALAELMAELDKDGKREDMEDVFPYSAKEIDGMIKLTDIDKYFLSPSSKRLNEKTRSQDGVPFKAGNRKAKLPIPLGSQFIKLYENIAGEVMTMDPVAVIDRMAQLLLGAMKQATADEALELIEENEDGN